MPPSPAQPHTPIYLLFRIRSQYKDGRLPDRGSLKLLPRLSRLSRLPLDKRLRLRRASSSLPILLDMASELRMRLDWKSIEPPGAKTTCE